MSDDAAKIAVLEQRIKDLEISKKYEATKEEVEKVEKAFLVKLRDIKAALAKEGSSSANSKELEQVKEANEKLIAENAKLKYRILHMKDSLEKLYKP